MSMKLSAKQTVMDWMWSVALSVLSCAFAISDGTVWPLPRYSTVRPKLFIIHNNDFDFKVTHETCDILVEAVKRYKDVIKQMIVRGPPMLMGDCSNTSCELPPLKIVDVELTSPCEPWPHINMEEHYEMHINSSESNVISSNSVWGILRGLETLSQLIYPSMSYSCWVINSTSILDYPRFRHRGLLLDTSRHFLPVSVILNILSAMEMNKMNVFHWHIVDDESFPYQSYTFPSLSDFGAYNPETMIYTKENVSSIVAYARLRGIRVIPEFDTPGHTQSWGKGVAKLLAACYTNGTFNGQFGPIDPSRSQNYKILKSLFLEIKQVFPDNYIHLGGDEVSFICWENNPLIKQFMEHNNFTSSDELEGYYIGQVLSTVHNISANGIVWQEVFQNNVTLHKDTIVHIWLGNRTDLLDMVTKSGHYTVLSEGWYLDHLEDQWQEFYRVDPTEFPGTQSQKALVLGGEACMWGEMVDETNIVGRVWPRASAIAERLWSSKQQTNEVEQAKPRLDKHVCYMRRRGVAAAPATGPGFCP